MGPPGYSPRVKGEKCFVAHGACNQWKGQDHQSVISRLGGDNDGHILTCPAQHYVKGQGFRRCPIHNLGAHAGLQELLTCCVATY